LYLAKFGYIQNMKVENLKYPVDNCGDFFKNFSQNGEKLSPKISLVLTLDCGSQ
jgi:hypothetical protein